MEALFTSLDGGDALRARLLALIAEAAALSRSKKVDLHVMMFAFTDEEIADRLAEAAVRHPAMTIRILADWSQRHDARGRQTGRLVRLDLPNLRVRFKKDQPYLWDAAASQLRWSYRVSRGLLHHKALGVLVDGRPWRLICGSFNWTATAARSYENMLIVNSDAAESCRLMSRIELEFEALWSDGGATLSPAEAELHYRAIVEEFVREPAISPAAVVGLSQGRDDPLQILRQDCWPRDADSVTANSAVEIAFSCPDSAGGRQRGHAESNRTQRFLLRTPSATVKRVPLTLTNLALDTIFRAAKGETLKVAMYGLSARVPEYGALLDAAKRGVQLFILLDSAVGSDVAARLASEARVHGMPLEIRTAGRIMHQKYVVNPRRATVLTGTANMSTDASARHLEHRIRISECPALAARFCADFDNIWSRLAANGVKKEAGKKLEDGG